MDSNERLDRIEKLFAQNAEQISLTQSLVERNSIAISTLLQNTQQLVLLRMDEVDQIHSSISNLKASLESIEYITELLTPQCDGSCHQ